MRSTSLLPLLSDSLRPGLVAPDRVLSMGKIELNCVLTLNWILWDSLFLHLTACLNWELRLNWIVLNRTFFLFLTVCIQKIYLYWCELFETFIKITSFGVKWPEKGLIRRKTKRPINQPRIFCEMRCR